MKPKRVNWYGLNHSSVKSYFEGSPVFCNSFCVKDEYYPVAVYRSKNPNRAKGHKDYMLLRFDDQGCWVRGMDEEEMEIHRYQTGVHCHSCDEVVYSVYRHDMRFCKCKSVFVDGGRSYTRYGATADKLFTIVKIDLIANKVVEFKR